MRTKAIILTTLSILLSCKLMAQGLLDTTRTQFMMLETYGTAYQQGYDHGAQKYREIAASLERYRFEYIEYLLQSAGTDLKYKDFKNFLIHKTDMFQKLEEESPEQYALMKGIANGAYLDFEDIFCYNLNYDETLWIVEALTSKDLSLQQAEGHCSHASFWNGQQNKIVYSFDWARWLDGTQLVWKMHFNNGLEVLNFTYAGIIAGQGVNNYGVGFTAHSTMELQRATTNATPSIMNYSKILLSKSKEEARNMLMKTHQAAPVAYTLFDRKGTEVLECGPFPTQHVEAPNQMLVQTNHSHKNKAFSAPFLQMVDAPENINRKVFEEKYQQKAILRATSFADSHQREKALLAIFSKEDVRQSPEVLKEKWKSTPAFKPFHKDNFYNNFCTITEIGKEKVKVWATPGEFDRFALDFFELTLIR
ncbi:C45 family autoproteolytic acyltransferase/hydolase [Persicobacter diffluens]|uniref:Peptidase C45 hydrolase domain-containing protein n=1 Tax=Persicobacter diffluens TaxID=981 RepID=A0AAN4W5M1_9BACT|nr:hypothetical protein PEDI_56530 [Persicobacter diffluens]